MDRTIDRETDEMKVLPVSRALHHGFGDADGVCALSLRTSNV